MLLVMGLEFLTLLPQVLGSKARSLCPGYTVVGIKPRACMLGKNSTKGSAPQLLDYNHGELRQGDDGLYKGVMLIQSQLFIELALEIVFDSSF